MGVLPSLHRVCAWCLWRSEESVITDSSCELLCGCWGLNLQELGVLLVSESSLQTLEGLSLEDSPQNLCLTLRLWKQTAGTRAQTVMPSEFSCR